MAATEAVEQHDVPGRGQRLFGDDLLRVDAEPAQRQRDQQGREQTATRPGSHVQRITGGASHGRLRTRVPDRLPKAS
jgi:hypothetical protein